MLSPIFRVIDRTRRPIRIHFLKYHRLHSASREWIKLKTKINISIKRALWLNDDDDSIDCLNCCDDIKLIFFFLSFKKYYLTTTTTKRLKITTKQSAATKCAQYFDQSICVYNRRIKAIIIQFWRMKYDMRFHLLTLSVFTKIDPVKCVNFFLTTRHFHIILIKTNN